MPKNPAQKRAPVSQIKKTQEFTNRRPRVILDYFSVASCAERGRWWYAVRLPEGVTAARELDVRGSAFRFG